jgi:membrane-bound lytic murein transglycosylase D
MLTHKMSLVHKIPPMISALAFGYGVGMAAPESTISSVHAAVSAYHEGMPRPPLLPSPGASVRAMLAPPPRVVAGSVGVGGDESRELSRLRESALMEDKRASSEVERPLYSRTPRYQSSTIDRDAEDADDLDAAGADALSRLQLPDLHIPVTRRTLKYVHFFTRTDRGRGMFETWLKRSGRYQEMIQGELRERRLPEDLIWVAMIESGFDARAKSPAGAVGLWQFMPSTGSVYGLQQTRALDQRKNPRLATQAAVHHLRDLYLRFGTWDLALAAYNMGYEQLLDSIDKYGTADFNELARQEAIPRETSSYVPKIAAAAIVANNLERFGFDKVDVSRPVDAAEIAVPPGTPLKILAKAAGVATSMVRTLNPDILGERVPPGRGDYLVNVPADTLSRARAALPAMLENEPLVGAEDDASVLDPVDLMAGRELLRRRTRAENDSLLSLLPRYHRRGTFRDPSPDGIDDRRDRDRDDDGDRADRDDDRPLSRALDDDAPHPSHHARHGRETVMYRVALGDTLAGIAHQFAVDPDDVSRANKMDDGDPLKVGALIRLRVRKDVLDKSPDARSDAAAEPEHKPAARDRNKDGKEPSAQRTPKRSDADDLAPVHKKHKKAHKDPT